MTTTTIDSSFISDLSAMKNAGPPLFEERRKAYISMFKKELATRRAALRRRHELGAGGTAVVRELSDNSDLLIRAAFSLGVSELGLFRRLGESEDLILGKSEFPASRIALIALGGYGRRELNPRSDLDVMFVYRGKLIKEFEQLNTFLLTLLWDIGFEVGHAIRSIDEGVNEALRDIVTLTTTLEARFVAGDISIFNDFYQRLMIRIRSQGENRFLTKKVEERNRAREQWGSEVYVTEPNLKEGPGGLRDYHVSMWISTVKFSTHSLADMIREQVITEREYLSAGKALDFLWRVRNEMHFAGWRRDDQLSFSAQQHVAKAFNYQASGEFADSQLFMQDYYLHASDLNQLYLNVVARHLPKQRSFIETIKQMRRPEVDRGLTINGDEISIPVGEANWFREEPSRLMEIIWYAQESGLRLSVATERAIEENLSLVDEEFCRSLMVKDYFAFICGNIAKTCASFRLMDRLGILGRYIPEFGATKDLVRFKDFHNYPVDEHTLRAVEYLSEIPSRGKEDSSMSFLKQALEEIKNPFLLVLAVLAHDLGKVADGPHVPVGVKLAGQIAERLSLSVQEREDLEFLVANHLKMSHLSQYRDISDPDVIRNFAAEVNDLRRLKMLYLLTYADLRAVAPNVWNDWKGVLLLQLYMKTEELFSRRAAVMAAETVGYHWESARAREVRGYLKNIDDATATAHLQSLPERYLMTFAPWEIAEHIRLVRRFQAARQSADESVVTDCKPSGEFDFSRVTVCTRDKTGVFAEIVGVFAACNINIVHAQLFTRSDGIVLDTFDVFGTDQLRDETEKGSLLEKRWPEVEEMLRRTIDGEVDVEDLVTKARSSLYQSAKKAPRTITTEIRFDNYSSSRYTILDLVAQDRLGLLYDIASAVADMGMDISTAKITTDSVKAKDAFYLADASGQKVLDEDRLNEISAVLKERIG